MLALDGKYRSLCLLYFCASEASRVSEAGSTLSARNRLSKEKDSGQRWLDTPPFAKCLFSA